jgi:hypothetical protein
LLGITGQGETKLKIESGDSIKLLHTLFIPFLGANLLSASQLYKAGLQGEFDSKLLSMRDKAGSLVIYTRKHGGVYVVEHIPKAFQNQAFSAEIHGQQSAFNSIPIQAQSINQIPPVLPTQQPVTIEADQTNQVRSDDNPTTSNHQSYIL